MIFPSEQYIVAQLKLARESKLLDLADTSIHFIDYATIKNRLDAVNSAFPAKSIHTVAVKTNPLSGVLKCIVNDGFSLEAASYEELMHARNCGAHIVAWDSPAKTATELSTATTFENVMINCDSLDEARQLFDFKHKCEVLLRINPQLRGSAHESMSVGNTYSKFGEAIANRDEIIDFVSKNDFITGLHVHMSSQTIDYTDLIGAVRRVIDLAIEIDTKRASPLKYVNIGGGFAVDYHGNQLLDIKDYAIALLKACPELSDGRYLPITEFGRYYHANAGFTLTQVAGVKHFDRHQVIIAHAGADMFLRECYQPGHWPHRYMLLDQNFEPKAASEITTDIAGPLCFGGDYLSKSISFPKANPLDWIVIRDTGANSVALWSKHCSRAFPKCILIHDEQQRVIRERDTLDRNLGFWS